MKTIEVYAMNAALTTAIAYAVFAALRAFDEAGSDNPRIARVATLATGLWSTAVITLLLLLVVFNVK